MNLSDLSREQKLFVGLGILISLLVVALFYVGVRLNNSSVTRVKLELEELERKIQLSDRVLSKRSVTSAKYQQTMAELKSFLTQTPPERNYYSWAAEIIYAKARDTGLEVDAIDEVSFNRAAPEPGGKKKTAPEIQLETYALSITAHGGYLDMMNFVQTVLADQPLVRFSDIEVNQGNSPELHDIRFVIQWPFRMEGIAGVWAAIDQKQTAAGVHRVKAVPAAPEKKAKVAVLPHEKSSVAKPVIAEAVSVPELHPEPIEKVKTVATPKPVQAKSRTQQVADSTSANKLEDLLIDQTRQEEKTFNSFIDSIQGGSHATN